MSLANFDGIDVIAYNETKVCNFRRCTAKTKINLKQDLNP